MWPAGEREAQVVASKLPGLKNHTLRGKELQEHDSRLSGSSEEPREWERTGDR